MLSALEPPTGDAPNSKHQPIIPVAAKIRVLAKGKTTVAIVKMPIATAQKAISITQMLVATPQKAISIAQMLIATVKKTIASAQKAISTVKKTIASAQKAISTVQKPVSMVKIQISTVHKAISIVKMLFRTTLGTQNAVGEQASVEQGLSFPSFFLHFLFQRNLHSFDSIRQLFGAQLFAQPVHQQGKGKGRRARDSVND
jgi:hypothetical protein